MATKISERVWRLDSDYPDVCGFPLWTYAVRSGDGVCLLDAGVSSTFAAVTLGELEAAGLSRDIDLVVVSHAHPDHLGGVGAIQQHSPACRVAGPAREVEWLEDPDVLLKELWGAYGDAFTLDEADEAGIRMLLGPRVHVDHLLRHGDTVPDGGGTLQALVTSGHSPGHLAVYDTAERILFSFDDVQGSGAAWLHSAVRLAPLYHDVDRYRTGLTALAALDFDCLAPSHGDVLDRDAGSRLIQESLDFVERVDGIVLQRLRTGRSTLKDVAAAIDADLGPYGGVGLQTAAIAKAHLDHHVRQGRVTPSYACTEKGS